MSPGVQNRTGNTETPHHGSTPHYSAHGAGGEEQEKTIVADTTPSGCLKLAWKKMLRMVKWSRGIVRVWGKERDNGKSR